MTTKRWHSTYKIDHVELARALADLDRLRDEPEANPGDTWQDDLPELPPLPETDDEVIAILVPAAGSRKRRRAKRPSARRHRRGSGR